MMIMKYLGMKDRDINSYCTLFGSWRLKFLHARLFMLDVMSQVISFNQF